jgi:hypothetical protein
MDRDMVERLRRAKGDTTPASSGPSSRSSSFSSTSLGPTPKGSWRVKRRLSRSSLASVTTFEEDEDEDIVDRGGGSDGPSRVEAWAAAGQPTPSTASSDVDSQVIEPPTGSSSVPPRSVADRKHERQRSSTMSFVPSLATLPPSPTQATGGDPLAAGFQVEAYAPRPLIGRPRSRTHLSTSSPSHLPGTPQRSRGPADPGAFDTPTAAANGAETSAPVSSLQFPLSASPIAPRVPTVTADTSPNLAQQSTPSLSPSRKFGVHASPEQRRESAPLLLPPRGSPRLAEQAVCLTLQCASPVVLCRPFAAASSALAAQPWASPVHQVNLARRARHVHELERFCTRPTASRWVDAGGRVQLVRGRLASRRGRWARTLNSSSPALPSLQPLPLLSA